MRGHCTSEHVDDVVQRLMSTLFATIPGMAHQRMLCLATRGLLHAEPTQPQIQRTPATRLRHLGRFGWRPMPTQHSATQSRYPIGHPLREHGLSGRPHGPAHWCQNRTGRVAGWPVLAPPRSVAPPPSPLGCEPPARSDWRRCCAGVCTASATTVIGSGRRGAAPVPAACVFFSRVATPRMHWRISTSARSDRPRELTARLGFRSQRARMGGGCTGQPLLSCPSIDESSMSACPGVEACHSSRQPGRKSRRPPARRHPRQGGHTLLAAVGSPQKDDAPSAFQERREPDPLPAHRGGECRAQFERWKGAQAGWTTGPRVWSANWRLAS